MGRCGCEMMIECEVKTGQTGESIESTRREGGDGVVVQVDERGKLIDKRGKGASLKRRIDEREGEN